MNYACGATRVIAGHSVIDARAIFDYFKNNLGGNAEFNFRPDDFCHWGLFFILRRNRYEHY